MTIRVRLVILCLVVSLLPAIPLSYLVQTLLEKSFDVGLNTTVEEALKGGAAISRMHLSRLHEDFERDVLDLIGRVEAGDVPLKGGAVNASSSGDSIRLTPVSAGGAAGLVADSERETAGPVWVTKTPEFLDLVGRANIVERIDARKHDDLLFFDTEDRAIQLAVWRPAAPGTPSAVVFHAETDPAFLYNANRLIGGRQIFAELRLTRPTLSRSFFYPFVIIYSVILVVSLLVALLMAERMARPIRRLAEGAGAVAGGDWTYRLDERSGGEVGRLVDAFNSMVSRLEGQQRRLVDMERIAAWREIARHLAHEIKNPLLPIRLTVEELKDQYTGDDPRYKVIVEESVRVIGEELDHLQRLVKEFSAFARMPDLNPRIASLDGLAKDVAGLYHQPGVDVTAQGGIGEFPFDPDQMRRVFVNLFDNAVAATRDAADPAIVVRVKRDGGRVIVAVSDNGCGIAPDHIERVFDPYFTTKQEGSGLGLAMIKNIIVLHGGTIDVESRAGAGTTFTFELPAAGPGYGGRGTH